MLYTSRVYGVYSRRGDPEAWGQQSGQQSFRSDSYSPQDHIHKNRQPKAVD